MEPLREWKWAYLDEKLARFEQTVGWMTDAEACAVFWVCSDQRSHRVEHTKRDRHRVAPLALVKAPAKDVDWTKEARQRAERSRFGLPPQRYVG
ncbi:hypothetical protein LJ655_25270 [Paraburkholderia sp. MMS20-SJTN17]|uniref:Uncharacterized protein n=1 Tax=Paraburkholderia translucens TaxID=2886945 RepID=A0ABS8KK70_9BURK|nr:hypothetical protein [Paraburkholderia sp. MMS20-SJTN17]MCC8405148.1 hypothetical protein [Paraburkholderia sp. MMS20-SJTN17]